MDDQIERSYQKVERARSRISNEGLRQTNINNYIASLTDMSNSEYAQGINPDHKKSLNVLL